MAAKNFFFVLLSTPIFILTIGSTQAQCPITVINCISSSTRVPTSAPSVSTWSNETGAIASGGSAATYSSSAIDALGLFGTTSSSLNIRNFGFTIPTYKHVCSATISIRRRRQSGGVVMVGPFVYDSYIGVGGNNLAVGGNWPSSYATQTYTVTDALTPATVNSSAFGVTIRVNSGSILNVLGSVDAEIDGISMTIYVDDTTILMQPCPLPVTLTSLTGDVEAGCVDLKWNVDTELSVKDYIVQKRIGDRFETIGEVEAKGQHDYSFLDCRPSDLNYYRLLARDNNGNEKDMNSIVSVQVMNKTSDELLLVPNPTASNSRVRSSSPIVNLKLFSSDGRLLSEIQPIENSNEVYLDLDQHANGNYIVQIQTNTGVYSEKFILKK